MVDLPSYCIALTGSSPGGLNTALQQFPNLLGGNWYALIWYGLMGSAFLITLVYMASQLLRIPKMDAWAKFELFQLALTAVLVLLVGGWVWGMCHWDVSFLANMTGDSQTLQHWTESMGSCGQHAGVVGGVSGTGASGAPIITPYCVAQSFLQRVKLRGDDVFQSMLALNYGLSYITRITWESRPLGIGYTIEPLAGLQQIQNIFLVGVSGFMLSYLSVLIQMRILDYFLISMPFFFMPLGVLLRCFPPTREFGGAVMGMGIACLLFFPLLLVMNDLAVYSSFEKTTHLATEIKGKLFGTSAIQFSCPSSDQALGNYKDGDTVQFPGGCQNAQDLPIGRILAQGSNQLVFESPVGGDGSPPSYELQRVSDATSPGGTRIDVYKIIRIIDPSLAEVQLDATFSGYENQPYGPASKREDLTSPPPQLEQVKEGDRLLVTQHGYVSRIVEQSKLWLIYFSDDDGMYMLRQDSATEWGQYSIDVRGDQPTDTVVGQVSGPLNLAALEAGGSPISSTLGDLTVAEVLEQDTDHAVISEAKGSIYTLKKNNGGIDIYRKSGLWPEKTGGAGRAVDYFTKPKAGTGLPFSDFIYGIFNPLLSVIGIASVYMVTAILLPIINFMVFIEIARTLSIFLGSELDLSNLTRLI